MNEKILCVDDELLILNAFQRQLRKTFEIVPALGGEEGLKALASDGPFAVVVSDLKMPGMDGIQFLAKVRHIAPDSVRVMLTGQADFTAAVAAVNEGSIFRFLTKPCPTETFSQVLSAAIEQHRLIIAEKELLEMTLRGSVKVLTEILGIVHPAAFGRSSRVRNWVRHMSANLNPKDQWSFELAALLSQIGCVTLPSDVLDKACRGEELSGDERKLFATHPDAGGRLIRDIPRLEMVAGMVERQQMSYSINDSIAPSGIVQQVLIGGQLLSVALDFDQWLIRGLSRGAAVQRLREREGFYNPALLEALPDIAGSGTRWVKRPLHIKDLRPSMVVDQDVRAYDGTLLLAKGLEISTPALECLRRFASSGRVREPIEILFECEVDQAIDASAITAGALV